MNRLERTLNMYTIKVAFILMIMMAATIVGAAEWVIDPTKSQLNFISTKKINVAEVHKFNNIEGQLNTQGQLEIEIDLMSVDTHIAIRDERIKTFLFEVNKFTTATLRAMIEPSALEAIAEGASERFTVDATLHLHGETQPLVADVIVTRLVGAKLSVVSVTPIILNAGDFSLVAGIDKLTSLAKLPSISHAVPVSFYLTFNLKREM